MQVCKIVKLSVDRVRHILLDNLGMRKRLMKWVPRLLTVDQKQQCIEDLKLLQYVTTGKTWFHDYTLESSRQSANWRARYENQL